MLSTGSHRTDESGKGRTDPRARSLSSLIRRNGSCSCTDYIHVRGEYKSGNRTGSHFCRSYLGKRNRIHGITRTMIPIAGRTTSMRGFSPLIRFDDTPHTTFIPTGQPSANSGQSARARSSTTMCTHPRAEIRPTWISVYTMAYQIILPKSPRERKARPKQSDHVTAQRCTPARNQSHPIASSFLQRSRTQSAPNALQTSCHRVVSSIQRMCRRSNLPSPPQHAHR